jgi:hypothetical protein
MYEYISVGMVIVLALGIGYVLFHTFKTSSNELKNLEK